MTAASASLATADVLAFIGDPSVWRGELEAWNEAYYVELYGQPGDVVDVPDVADDDEAACPVCRPGAVADGARSVRCILHGGESEAIQPTNASGFRLAGDGRGDGACAACIGTGRESGGGVCPACDGTGEAPDVADDVEAACPVCRLGAVADGVLEGGPVSAPAGGEGNRG